MQQYLNKQLPESAKDKFTNLERMVLDLRATGRSDDEIATLLSGWMNSGKFNLPAVAAGTMGLGSMQVGDEPQQ